MATKVVMPQMGESVVEGKVAKWLVKEGDLIKMDQPIAEISTDKVDVEIPAPGAGRLEKILVPEGETVSIGAELAFIQEAKEEERKEEARKFPSRLQPTPEQPSQPAPPKAPPPPAGEEKEGRISPLVKRLAEQYQVDLQKVPGTGIGGRITKQDLFRYIGKAEEETPPGARREVSPKAIAKPEEAIPPKPELAEYRTPQYEPKEGDQVIPFSRLRKIIAEHMVYSKRTAPHVTTVTEIDMTKVVRLREEKRTFVKEQTGSDLTFLPFVLFAAIQAVHEYPILNASVMGDSLIIKKEIHMGIAVETEKGLMVPVIRRAHEKSLIGLSRVASELAVKAREGKLTPDEVTGGTFTVSNPGKKGNLFGTPIIFQPQVAILRMGEIVKKPVVIEVDGADTIGIHPVMYLSLSYDHRVIDGAPGNLFLHRVKEILEEGRFSF